MNNNTSSVLAYTADELLNLAIMTKVPVLIVEGVDDIPIYERISMAASVNCDVYASETLAGGLEGCTGVINNIAEIRNISGNIPIENFVIGIIDRDVRFYRNEIPDDPAVFALDYYSIESHYISACSIEYLVPRFTKATKKLIKPETADNIYQSLCSGLSFLYYVSLEALRNACELDYVGEFGYSMSIKAILNKNLDKKLLEKQTILDVFAKSLGLSFSMDTLLKICKGKWIIEIYSDLLYEAIKNLPASCMDATIPQCQSCSNNEPNKCLYKKTSFVSADILMNQAYLNTDAASLNYIKDRIIQLGEAIQS